MRFIETPVQVIYTDDPRSEGGEPFIVDAYGYKMLLRGIGVGVGGLDDRAVEAARAINVHDALVETVQNLLNFIVFETDWRGETVDRAEKVLRLAKGETK